MFNSQSMMVIYLICLVEAGLKMCFLDKNIFFIYQLQDKIQQFSALRLSKDIGVKKIIEENGESGYET